MEYFLLTILGLCIGSFLNVVILRLPKSESISLPASHCPTCKHPLKWYHNIPVFSWIVLRGHCAFCKTKISMQYPLIEITTALLFLFVGFKTNFSYHTFALALLFSLLLALSMIDLKYKAIPDSLSLPALFVSLFVANIMHSFNNALLFAGGFTLLRFVISWVIKKEAMGEADIIIVAIIGSVLGVKLGLAAIYISALIALPVFLIVSKKGYEMPFIPFLAFGLLMTWTFSAEVTNILRMIYG